MHTLLDPHPIVKRMNCDARRVFNCCRKETLLIIKRHRHFVRRKLQRHEGQNHNLLKLQKELISLETGNVDVYNKNVLFPVPQHIIQSVIHIELYSPYAADPH